MGIVILYGCTPKTESITYDEGVDKINEFNENFDVNMKTYPKLVEDINLLIAQITGFAVVNENSPKSLKYLIDYRINSLEAEKLFLEGWQWGRGSTTDWGFGCNRGFSRIINSTILRNNSAQKGYEAIDTLKLFIDEFPEDAMALNLTQKDVLFQNAEYFKSEEKARRDAIIVTSLCKKKNNTKG